MSQAVPQLRTSQWVLRPVVGDRGLSRRLHFALALELFFFSAIVGSLLALGRMQAGIWFYVCGAAAIVLAIGFRINMDAWRYAITKPLAATPVEELHGVPDHTRVTLDIARGSLITGTDRGSIWFESGAMCFLGQTTSFAITADLIRPDGVQLFERPLRPFERQMMISLTTGWRLQLDLASAQWTTCEDLRQKISSLDASGDIRQHPPVSLGPGAFGRGALARFAAAKTVQLAVFGIIPAAFFVILAIAVDPRFGLYLLGVALLRPWQDGLGGLRHSLGAWRELALMSDG